MSNHRYSKFWWQDWHGDKALHACSVGARGFWMELLCIAHDGNPYGHVTISGDAATLKQMAGCANCTEREAQRWLAELEQAKVFSRTTEGTIFSRRMIRDAKLAEEGAKNVAKRKDRSPSNTPPNNGGYKAPYKPPSYSIDHRSESESESARGHPSLVARQAPPLSEAGRLGPSEPYQRSPETEAVILSLQERAGRVDHALPQPRHLSPEQLAMVRGKVAAQ